MRTCTDADLAARIAVLPWVHTIDLGNGIVTPGAWPPSPLILRAFESLDFRGKKVLDIGCWDGLWSFEAEKRGAREVHATDDTSQRPHRDQPTFQVAHQALRSRVRYHPNLSVYDLDKFEERDFDVVLFLGVYYHLKNPLLALARIREVMREGGLLIIEGEVLHGRKDAVARFSYRHKHKDDASNWWLPTVPCLHEWLECSFFEVVHGEDIASVSRDASLWSNAKCWIKRHLGFARPTASRYLAIARAVKRADDRYIYPDPDLPGCFRN